MIYKSLLIPTLTITTLGVLILGGVIIDRKGDEIIENDNVSFTTQGDPSPTFIMGTGSFLITTIDPKTCMTTEIPACKKRFWKDFDDSTCKEVTFEVDCMFYDEVKKNENEYNDLKSEYGVAGREEGDIACDNHLIDTIDIGSCGKWFWKDFDDTTCKKKYLDVDCTEYDQSKANPTQYDELLVRNGLEGREEGDIACDNHIIDTITVYGNVCEEKDLGKTISDTNTKGMCRDNSRTCRKVIREGKEVLLREKNLATRYDPTGKTEVCDGRDNDCDGQVDEGYQQKEYLRDFDGDGWGNIDMKTKACLPPLGHVLKPGDCDDLDKEIYPGAYEVCDLKDNNCNRQIDEYLVDCHEEVKECSVMLPLGGNGDLGGSNFSTGDVSISGNIQSGNNTINDISGEDNCSDDINRIQKIEIEEQMYNKSLIFRTDMVAKYSKSEMNKLRDIFNYLGQKQFKKINRNTKGIGDLIEYYYLVAYNGSQGQGPLVKKMYELLIKYPESKEKIFNYTLDIFEGNLQYMPINDWIDPLFGELIVTYTKHIPNYLVLDNYDKFKDATFISDLIINLGYAKNAREEVIKIVDQLTINPNIQLNDIKNILEQAAYCSPTVIIKYFDIISKNIDNAGELLLLSLPSKNRKNKDIVNFFLDNFHKFSNYTVETEEILKGMIDIYPDIISSKIELINQHPDIDILKERIEIMQERKIKISGMAGIEALLEKYRTLISVISDKEKQELIRSILHIDNYPDLLFYNYQLPKDPEFDEIRKLFDEILQINSLNIGKKTFSLSNKDHINLYVGLLKTYIQNKDNMTLLNGEVNIELIKMQYEKNLNKFIVAGKPYSSGSKLNTFIVRADVEGGDDHNGAISVLNDKSIELYQCLGKLGTCTSIRSNEKTMTPDEIIALFAKQIHNDPEGYHLFHLGGHGGTDGSLHLAGGNRTKDHFDKLFNLQVAHPGHIRIDIVSCNSFWKDDNRHDNQIANISLDSSQQVSFTFASMYLLEAFEKKDTQGNLEADYDEDGVVNYHEALIYRAIHYNMSLTPIMFDDNGKVVDIVGADILPQDIQDRSDRENDPFVDTTCDIDC